MTETTGDNSEANANWHPNKEVTDIEGASLRPYERSALDNLQAGLRSPGTDQNTQGLLRRASQILRTYKREVPIYEKRGYYVNSALDLCDALLEEKTHMFDSLRDEFSKSSDNQDAEEILDAMGRVNEEVQAINLLKSTLTEQRREAAKVAPLGSMQEAATSGGAPIEEIKRGDMAEKASGEKILAETLRVMLPGTSLVHTVIPYSSERAFVQSGEKKSPGEVPSGFQTLGESNPKDYMKTFQIIGNINRQLGSSPVEAVFFTPAMHQSRQTVEERSGFLNRKTTRTVVTEQPKTAINPETGKEESVILMAYEFNSQAEENHVEGGYDRMVTYWADGRRGNSLFVALEMPQSAAEHLKDAIKNNPTLARELAKQVVVSDRTGVTEHDWSVGQNISGDNVFRVSPPYSELPADWKLAVMDTTEGSRTNIPIR